MTDPFFARFAPERRKVPAATYLLADHLDAALAIGEDLARVGRSYPWRLAREGEDILDLRAEQRRTIERIRLLELALIVRLIKARERAQQLAEAEDNFKALARLYVSTTGILLDAVEECADQSTIDFDTGDGLTAYLRSRALLAKDVAGIDEATAFAVTDDFLVARRMPLGVLLDLSATFLEALEAQYELYAGATDGSAEPGDLALGDQIDTVRRMKSSEALLAEIDTVRRLVAGTAGSGLGIDNEIRLVRGSPRSAA